MTDTTDHPSRRAGLRDEIAQALEAADYRLDMKRGDLADTIMPVLYREWLWLRAEAEDASVVVPAADRAALVEAAAQAIRDAACPGGDCPLTEEECADQRIQPAAWERGVLSEVYGRPEWFADAVLSRLPAPADRAAVLREVLAALDAALRDFFEQWADEPRNSPWAHGWKDATEVVRRMAGESAAVDRVAAETPPAETQTADVFLSTPCDTCRHTLNWHRNDVGCTVALCVCGRFQQPTGPAVEAQPGKDTETRIVAYRSNDGRLLYCTGHAGELFGLGYTAVTADDLPDGGICTHPDCGVDVLIPQQPKEA
jgi:hypothetical protein